MTMTYTRCVLCNGTKQLPEPDGSIPFESRVKPCPCSRSSTPVWSPTGVTEKQLERLVECRNKLMVLLIASEAAAPYRLMEMRAEYRQKHAPIIPTAEMGEAR